ncbi:MAG: GNAT family N-acetyltransferase [Rhizobiaceae bacterium]
MTARPITIRRYAADDLDAVIGIFQRAIREVAARDYSPDQIAAWSAVERNEWEQWRLSRPAWIAEIEGRPAGFTDLEDDGHLDMMFVHPDHQGVGVATALLDAVEKHAAALGLAAIYAEASITARPFFVRRGFRIVRQGTVETGGEAFTIFHVEKDVADGTP